MSRRKREPGEQATEDAIRKAVDDCLAIIDAAAATHAAFSNERTIRHAIACWLFAECRDRKLRALHLDELFGRTVAISVQVVMDDRGQLGSLFADLEHVRYIALADWGKKK
jgi:hypothetical protein